ncbi:hypothetical protein VTI74DRAFT_10067 [Chaetomium olivicolor]
MISAACGWLDDVVRSRPSSTSTFARRTGAGSGMCCGACRDLRPRLFLLWTPSFLGSGTAIRENARHESGHVVTRIQPPLRPCNRGFLGQLWLGRQRRTLQSPAPCLFATASPSRWPFFSIAHSPDAESPLGMAGSLGVSFAQRCGELGHAQTALATVRQN